MKLKAKESCLKKYNAVAPMCNDKVKEKSIKTCLKKYGTVHFMSSDEGKDFWKKEFKKLHGVENPSQSESFYNRKRKIEYCGFKFDSSYEVKFFKYLKEQNIDFEMQKRFPKPYFANGKKHFTFVDFHLLKENVWIEIKGAQFFDEDLNPVFPYGKNKDIKQHNYQESLWKEKHKFLIANNIHIATYINNHLIFFN